MVGAHEEGTVGYMSIAGKGAVQPMTPVSVEMTCRRSDHSCATGKTVRVQAGDELKMG